MSLAMQRARQLTGIWAVPDARDLDFLDYEWVLNLTVPGFCRSTSLPHLACSLSHVLTALAAYEAGHVRPLAPHPCSTPAYCPTWPLPAPQTMSSLFSLRDAWPRAWCVLSYSACRIRCPFCMCLHAQGLISWSSLLLTCQKPCDADQVCGSACRRWCWCWRMTCRCCAGRIRG